MATAQDIIEDIAASLDMNPAALSADDRRRIRNALEDGEALAAMGFGDEDQEAVEEAHSLMQ